MARVICCVFLTLRMRRRMSWRLGTAQAAASLVQQVGGKVCGIATVIELDFLHGRDRLTEHELYTLIHY